MRCQPNASAKCLPITGGVEKKKTKTSLTAAVKFLFALMGPLCDNSMCNGSPVVFHVSIPPCLCRNLCTVLVQPCLRRWARTVVYPLCPKSDRRYCNSSVWKVMSFSSLKIDVIPLFLVGIRRSMLAGSHYRSGGNVGWSEGRRC